VGADRALKRLALQRVRDIDLWHAPLVREGEAPPPGDFDVPYALQVDPSGRPQGWLVDGHLSPRGPVVELDDVLRDALSDLLQAQAQYGPVVDPSGAVVGVLSLEIISEALQTVPVEA
jgi:osmoprotectant transport system ATP-binding protein